MLQPGWMSTSNDLWNTLCAEGIDQPSLMDALSRSEEQLAAFPQGVMSLSVWGSSRVDRGHLVGGHGRRARGSRRTRRFRRSRGDASPVLTGVPEPMLIASLG